MFKSLGERLKQLVKEKGMEQQEVATELGIKSATFNGYISNKREPSLERIKQFAVYFDVSVDYLTGYTEIRTPFLKHLTEEQKAFVENPGNTVYIELAMNIMEKTLSVERTKKTV